MIDKRLKRYMQIVGEVHLAWSRRNVPDRYAPGEHPPGSDYTVEVLDVEATGAQLDEYYRMLREALDVEDLFEFGPAPDSFAAS